jgi:hypothetical protein
MRHSEPHDASSRAVAPSAARAALGSAPLRPPRRSALRLTYTQRSAQRRPGEAARRRALQQRRLPPPPPAAPHFLSRSPPAAAARRRRRPQFKGVKPVGDRVFVKARRRPRRRDARKTRPPPRGGRSLHAVAPSPISLARI